MSAPDARLGQMRVPAVMLLVVAVMWSSAGSAAAHGDDGELRLVALRPTEIDHGVEVVVDLAYDDGHAVYRGSVRLAGRSDTGASLLPVPLDATTIDGRYVTRVELPPPGVWTLSVTSQEPTAALEVVVDSSSPDYVDETVEPLPAPTDHGMPWEWILMGMTVVAVVGFVWSRHGRRRRQDRRA